MHRRTAQRARKSGGGSVLTTDAHGRRWAVASARSMRGCRSRVLTARIVDLPDSNNINDALERLTAPRADARLRGYFLRGDEFRQSFYYDISEPMRSPSAVAHKLTKRRVARVDEEPARPNWWAENLPQAAEAELEASGADGLLLAHDWLPSAALPWSRAVEEAFGRAEAFTETAAWLFDAGAPSLRVRGAYADALRQAARENLRRTAQRFGKEARLGVVLPYSRRRAWRITPAQLEADGVVPALDIPPVEPREFLRSRASLRLDELRRTRNPAALAPSEEWARLLWSVGVNPIGAGAGYGAPFDAAPLEEGGAAVLQSTEDKWASGQNAETNRRDRLFAQAAQAVRRLGVECAVVEEAELIDMPPQRVRLLMVGPWRSLRTRTLDALETRFSKKQLALLEPIPHLLDGAPSPRLERWLSKMRRRRLELDSPSFEKRLQAWLVKSGAEPQAGVYRRSDGYAPAAVWSRLMSGGDDEYFTFAHEEPRPLELLVERAAERSRCERWTGREWKPLRSWTADGHTFTALESAPRRFETIRLR